MAQNTGLWFILCTLDQIWAIPLDLTIATGVNEYQPQKGILHIITRWLKTICNSACESMIKGVSKKLWFQFFKSYSLMSFLLPFFIIDILLLSRPQDKDQQYTPECMIWFGFGLALDWYMTWLGVIWFGMVWLWFGIWLGWVWFGLVWDVSCGVTICKSPPLHSTLCDLVSSWFGMLLFGFI